MGYNELSLLNFWTEASDVDRSLNLLRGQTSLFQFMIAKRKALSVLQVFTSQIGMCVHFILGIGSTRILREKALLLNPPMR